MMRIVFATNNEGKMREIREILSDLDVDLWLCHTKLLILFQNLW